MRVISTARAVSRARIRSLALLALLAGMVALYVLRRRLLGPGWDRPVRLGTAVALLAVGWTLARDLQRSVAPAMYGRLERHTAGTVDFIVRLVTMLVIVVAALRIAGLTPRTLALGGAVGAVIAGLAAQQTLANFMAGTVLITAHPFRVGERVRLQGGPLAGTLEGVVSSLGLFYTTLARGDDAIMVPNSVVLNVAVVPLREPQSGELQAPLGPRLTPIPARQVLRDS